MPTGILSEGEAEGGSEVTPKEEDRGPKEATEEPEEEETSEMLKAPCWAPCSGLRHLWGSAGRESGLSHFTV